MDRFLSLCSKGGYSGAEYSNSPSIRRADSFEKPVHSSRPVFRPHLCLDRPFASSRPFIRKANSFEHPVPLGQTGELCGTTCLKRWKFPAIFGQAP